MKPICQYCGNEARLVKGDMVYPNPAFADLNIWQCAPCDAYVGCHNKGKFFDNDITPKGTLANAELRKLRGLAHEAFDYQWKQLDLWAITDGRSADARNKAYANARSAAYAWLAEQMGLPPEKCHIAMFNDAQCMQVVALCTAFAASQSVAKALKS